MRTTVTLDDDTEQVVRARMEAKGVSFKKALNDAIREGADRRTPPAPFRQRTHDMGVPKMGLTKALQFAGELEDEEIIAKMRRDA
jgi:hypothetical protein